MSSDPQPPPPEDPDSPWLKPHGSGKPTLEAPVPGRRYVKHGNRATMRNKHLQTKLLLDTALRKLERALGGRAAIAAALHLAEDITASEKAVAEAIANPRNARRSLRRLIADTDPDMTFAKVLKMFAKGRTAETYAKTINNIHRGLPAAADHLMKTSVPYPQQCPACHGKKKVAEGGSVKCEDCRGAGCGVCRGAGSFRAMVPCLQCAGTGELLREPDTDRMRLAFQVSGMLQQGGGISITNNQVTQQVEATFVQTSAAFRSATDNLLWAPAAALPPAQPEEYFEKPAVEAELVEEE